MPPHGLTTDPLLGKAYLREAAHCMLCCSIELPCSLSQQACYCCYAEVANPEDAEGDRRGASKGRAKVGGGCRDDGNLLQSICNIFHKR